MTVMLLIAPIVAFTCVVIYSLKKSYDLIAIVFVIALLGYGCQIGPQYVNHITEAEK